MTEYRRGGLSQKRAVILKQVASAALISALIATLTPAVAQTTAPAGAGGGSKAAPQSKPSSSASGTPHRAGTPHAAPHSTHGQARPHGQAAQQRRGHVPPPTTPAQRAALPAADDPQKAAADLVYYGKYVCDQKWEIHVERNADSPGYVDVRYQKDVWVMKPVASATGAVRLEDMKHQTLLVQIPSKSMLLNTRTGQRLVDSCVGEGHVQALQAIKAAEVSAAAETAAASGAPSASTASAASGSAASPAQTSGSGDPVAPARKPD